MKRMDRGRAVRTRKLLGFELRHDPGALGLVLDPGGQVSVDDVLRALGARGESVTRP